MCKQQCNYTIKVWQLQPCSFPVQNHGHNHMQMTQEPVIGYLLEWHCEIIWEQYLSNGTYSTVRNRKRAGEIGNGKNIYNYCTRKLCTAHSLTNNEWMICFAVKWLLRMKKLHLLYLLSWSSCPTKLHVECMNACRRSNNPYCSINK